MSRHVVAVQQASVPPYGSTKPVEVPADLDYEMWIGPAPMKPYTADRATSFGAYHIYDYALGFIAGWGAHPLDIAQWGLGADRSGPVHYEGTGKIPPKGSLWDSIESWDVDCEYAGGVKMRFMGERVAKPVVTGLSSRLGRPRHDLLRRQGVDQRQPFGPLRQRQSPAKGADQAGRETPDRDRVAGAGLRRLHEEPQADGQPAGVGHSLRHDQPPE